MKKFQLLRLRMDQEPKRWEMVAHGARYNRRDCDEMFKLITHNGDKAMSIEIPD